LSLLLSMAYQFSTSEEISTVHACSPAEYRTNTISRSRDSLHPFCHGRSSLTVTTDRVFPAASRGTSRGPGARSFLSALGILSRPGSASVQAERLGRRAVLMVRRRSTVRFRKGAPGRLAFSNTIAILFVAFVGRVVETLHCSHCSDRSLLMVIDHPL
jgi:hypothetical protein